MPQYKSALFPLISLCYGATHFPDTDSIVKQFVTSDNYCYVIKTCINEKFTELQKKNGCEHFIACSRLKQCYLKPLTKKYVYNTKKS